MTRGRALPDRMLDPALATNAAAVMAFLYVPMVVLVVFSFSASRYAAVWGGFSTEWYEKLVRHDEVLSALANSLVVGVSVAVISTVIGTATALALERHATPRVAAAGGAAVTLPIAMPDVVQGVALLMSFKLVWFAIATGLFGVTPELGRATVIVAHTAYAFAYVTVVVRARLAGMSAVLEEAAGDLGASPWTAFRRVTLPLLAPAVVGGFLLAFTLSLDEFVITFFNYGPDSQTLPVQMWSSVRYDSTPEINALSAVLVVASVVFVTAAALLQRRPR